MTEEREKSMQDFIDKQVNGESPNLFLNSYTIVKNYPKAMERIKKTIEDKGIQLKDDDFLQIISATPRFLYDIFDSNEVYLSIEGVENEWSYDIIQDFVEGDKTHRKEKLKSRIQAEYQGFMKAFEILNNK